MIKVGSTVKLVTEDFNRRNELAKVLKVSEFDGTVYKIEFKNDNTTATVTEEDVVEVNQIDPLERYEIEKIKAASIPKRVRGFEICKGFENTATIPTRGSKGSAGYDFYSPVQFSIWPNEVVKIKTGIKAYMQDDEVLLVYIRSSVGIDRNTINANCVCVIDEDYYNNTKNEGNIILALHNRGDNRVSFDAGDKLVQGIFTKYLKVDNDVVTTKRTGGIGSTGIK